MCNLYTMTATVDELRRVFGSFDGDRDNLPPFTRLIPAGQRRFCDGTLLVGSRSNG